eukprot:480103_1
MAESPEEDLEIIETTDIPTDPNANANPNTTVKEQTTPVAIDESVMQPEETLGIPPQERILNTPQEEDLIAIEQEPLDASIFEQLSPNTQAQTDEFPEETQAQQVDADVAQSDAHMMMNFDDPTNITHETDTTIHNKTKSEATGFDMFSFFKVEGDSMDEDEDEDTAEAEPQSKRSQTMTGLSNLDYDELNIENLRQFNANIDKARDTDHEEEDAEEDMEEKEAQPMSNAKQINDDTHSVASQRGSVHSQQDDIDVEEAKQQIQDEEAQAIDTTQALVEEQLDAMPTGDDPFGGGGTGRDRTESTIMHDMDAGMDDDAGGGVYGVPSQNIADLLDPEEDIVQVDEEDVFAYDIDNISDDFDETMRPIGGGHVTRRSIAEMVDDALEHEINTADIVEAQASFIGASDDDELEVTDHQNWMETAKKWMLKEKQLKEEIMDLEEELAAQDAKAREIEVATETRISRYEEEKNELVSGYEEQLEQLQDNTELQRTIETLKREQLANTSNLKQENNNLKQSNEMLKQTLEVMQQNQSELEEELKSAKPISQDQDDADMEPSAGTKQYWSYLEEKASADAHFADPLRVKAWNHHEVAYWLKGIKCEKYAIKFIEEHVSGQQLIRDMNSDVLSADLGIKRLHCGKILREIESLKLQAAITFSVEEGVNTATYTPNQLEIEKSEREALEKAFDEYVDPDQNGDVDIDEWFLGIQKMNVQLNETQQSAVFRFMDKDESGFIQKNDFVMFATARFDAEELQSLQAPIRQAVRVQSEKEDDEPRRFIHDLRKKQTETDRFCIVDVDTIMEWNHEEVAYWISSIGFEQYAFAFYAMPIDGDMLIRDMTKGSLMEDLGVMKIHIGQILRQIDKLRAIINGGLHEEVMDCAHLDPDLERPTISTIESLQYTIETLQNEREQITQELENERIQLEDDGKQDYDYGVNEEVMKEQMELFEAERKIISENMNQKRDNEYKALCRFTCADVVLKIKWWKYNDVDYRNHLMQTMQLFSDRGLHGNKVHGLACDDIKLMMKHDLNVFLTDATMDIMFNCFAAWREENEEDIMRKPAAAIACMLYHYPLDTLMHSIRRDDIDGKAFIERAHVYTMHEFMKEQTGWKQMEIYQIESLLFGHQCMNEKEFINNL